MEIIVRKGKMKEFREILEILQATPSALHGMPEEQELMSMESFVRGSLTDPKMNLVLVAERCKEIVGCLFAELWVKKGFSFLSMIAVLPQWKGKGIGEMLYSGFEEYCRKIKGTKALVWLVGTENKAMAKFCRKIKAVRGKRFYYYEKEL
ncbi:GNAT family N-acetyltransferase [Candidatus Woesearchaeota archaeon]|nr:GNAT family N-acetyltransferase [Candidatus Woesearchaeota archaeon]